MKDKKSKKVVHDNAEHKSMAKEMMKGNMPRKDMPKDMPRKSNYR